MLAHAARNLKRGPYGPRLRLVPRHRIGQHLLEHAEGGECPDVTGGPLALLLLALGPLAVCVLLASIVHRRGADSTHRAPRPDADRDAPIGPRGAFRPVVEDRYLMLVAGLALVLAVGGIDLNNEDCRCGAAAGDPRMSIFQTIKIGR